MSQKVIGLKCIRCGKLYKEDEVEYVCNDCGGNLDVVYDYDYLKKTVSREKISQSNDFSVWRYWDFYPLTRRELIPPLQIGWTPLYDSGRLGKHIGYENFWIKDDGRNPSASYKDRAGAVAVVKALEKGADIIAGASTGNAASSLSCITASIGLKTIIFVPKTAPKAKIAQLLIFGAKVVMVDGSYDYAFDLCLEATAKYGWYNRNTGYNPYTREGKKSSSFEVVEQLNWTVPDNVFVPVGDGNIISGVWKGYKDLYGAGLIDRLPRLIAVQAEGSAAIVNAANGDGKIRPVKADTIADSISVDLPRDGEAAVKAIKESGGIGITVSDEEILESMKIMGRFRGVFGEPAGSAPFAGLLKLLDRGELDKSETSVVLVTGNGLKDVESAKKAVGEPFLIKPSIDELSGIVDKLLK